jgi:hypothetical protein
MAADFGINVQIISEQGLRTEINKIAECLKGSGVELEVDPDQPGLGALIATLIRAIEKALIAAYEPLIALVNVVTEALKAGVRAPIVFIDKIVDLTSGLAELLANLPISIIEFIIERILQPIAENILIPFPGAAALLEILTGRVKLAEINWQEWLASGKLVIPEKLRARGESVVNQVLTLFQSQHGLPPAIIKIFELLLFPFKFAIGVLESVIDFVQGLVSNIFKAVAELANIVGDPVGWLIGFIADIFAQVLLPIVSLFIPVKIDDLVSFGNRFAELIGRLFSGLGSFDLNSWLAGLLPEERAPFEAILGFIRVLRCLIIWLVGLLNPATILGLLGLQGGVAAPPVEGDRWTFTDRSIRTKGVEPSDLALFYKPGSRVLVKLGTEQRQGTISRISGREIITQEPLFSQNRTGNITIQLA